MDYSKKPSPTTSDIRRRLVYGLIKIEIQGVKFPSKPNELNRMGKDAMTSMRHLLVYFVLKNKGPLFFFWTRMTFEKHSKNN